MFLKDPTLRLIATRTGDVWAEHLWRHDTAEDTSPLAALARHLHRIALRFNDNDNLLHRLLDQQQTRAEAIAHGLAMRSTVFDLGATNLTLELHSSLVTHRVLGDMLDDAYRHWRDVSLPQANPAEHYMLLRPMDPTGGVVTLLRIGDDHKQWHVIADAQAASAYGIPYIDHLVGEIAYDEPYYFPKAYSSAQTPPDMQHRLPQHDDARTACRSLLGWWRLVHSEHWRSRQPQQLTGRELIALSD